MEQRRRQTTVEQLNLLVEFLEQHKDLALGRVRSKEARALSARLWRECSLILNSEGPARTGKEWAKVWNDLKCRVRAKLVSINASHQATGGGPSTAASLTPLEERIGNILGRDVGPLPNVRQDPFATENDSNIEGTEEIIIDNQLELDPEILDQECEHEPQDLLDNTAHEVIPVSPAPSITRQVSPTPGTSGQRERLIRERQQQRQRARRTAAREAVPPPPPPAQSNRTALDESRAMMLSIERMRAEAELINARARESFSEGFKLLAHSIDNFTRQYTQRHQRDPDSPRRET